MPDMRVRTRLAPLRSTKAAGGPPVLGRSASRWARAGGVLDQIVVGPTGGQDEAQRALEHPSPLCVHPRATDREEAVGLREIQPVPDLEAVAEPVHLAVTRRRGERERVEIVHHDLPAGGVGGRAALVGAEARRDHLAQLVGGSAGAPVRRVAHLLQLGGQGAGPDRVALAAKPADGLHSDGLREPPPVDRRIVIGLLRVEQLAVLDEEQGVDQERRHRLEAAVDLLGILGDVERPPVAIDHLETGAGLLVIRRGESPRREVLEARRHPGLLLDAIAGRVESIHEVGQAGIAEALVVGAGARNLRRGIRPRLHPVGQHAGHAGEQEGLHRRRAGLDERGEDDDEHQHRDQDRRAMQALAHPIDPGERAGPSREDVTAQDSGGERGLGGRAGTGQTPQREPTVQVCHCVINRPSTPDVPLGHRRIPGTATSPPSRRWRAGKV
jgi:hypothetical protein